MNSTNRKKSAPDYSDADFPLENPSNMSTYSNDGYFFRHNSLSKVLLKTNPNFNTNVPPFEVRGCKVILGGAFLGQGVQALVSI